MHHMQVITVVFTTHILEVVMRYVMIWGEHVEEIVAMLVDWEVDHVG